MGASQTVLVTGAGGFIGRRLCSALASHSRVRGLVRTAAVEGPWQETIVADIADESMPSGLMDGVEVVFHLAGRAHVLDERTEDEPAYQRVNVEGTRRLCEMARLAGVQRFVFASSVAVLGEGSGGVVAEDAAPSPRTSYGRSKRDAEEIVRALGDTPSPVILRFPLVYGPGLKGNLRAMIDAVTAGRVPRPPLAAGRRSMLHVDDAVAALVLAGAAPGAAGRTYTVTDGRGYSTREVYDAICAALGRRAGFALPRLVFKCAALAGDAAGAVTGRRFVFDSAAYAKLFGSALYESRALREDLGFAPRWTLERAMPDMVGPGPGA